MEPNDYLYLYLYFLKTATKFDNTNDREIVYEASKDARFNSIIHKYGEVHFSNVMNSLVNEMISQGILIGVQTKTVNLITGVAPIGYSILAKSEDDSFMNKLLKLESTQKDQSRYQLWLFFTKICFKQLLEERFEYFQVSNS